MGALTFAHHAGPARTHTQGSSFAHGLSPMNVSNALYSKYLWAIANVVSLGSAFVAELEANYPLSRHNSSSSRGSALHLTLLDIVGDSNLACTAHDTTMLLAATANETVATTHPAYAYSFTYLAKQSGYQALHASDLPFFFGDSGEFDTADLFTAEERTLRSAMQRNLLHFVATGRPAASDWMQ
jgi:hypothetical protein